MKKLLKAVLVTTLASMLATSVLAQSSSLGSFTYQGRLNDTNGPANGLYDFSFALFTASTGGNQVGTSVARTFLPVTNGLFTISLEFLDANSFSGADRWLEIAVHPSGVGTNLTLSPRQPITSAPYALRALSANAASTVSGLIVNTNLSSVALGTGNTASAEYATVSGGTLNVASGANATVGGGDFNGASGNRATVAGGYGNVASGYTAALGGGLGNRVSGNYATLGGGDNNLASGGGAFVGGGSANQATNTLATVPGGENNLAGGQYSFAAGQRAKALHDGTFVWADASPSDYASTGNNQFLIRASGGVGIGTSTPAAALDVAGTIRADYLQLDPIDGGTEGGELLLKGAAAFPDWNMDVSGSALRFHTLGGVKLQIDPAAGVTVNGNVALNGTLGTMGIQPLEFYANGQRGLRLEPTASTDTVNVIGGSARNFVGAGVVGATIGGGGSGNYGGGAYTNRVTADFATVGGGNDNLSSGGNATVAGGTVNTASGLAATVGGGYLNTIQQDADYATIGGGRENTIQNVASFATIGGGFRNTNQSGAFYATIGGGFRNTIQSSTYFATIGGGSQNTAYGNYATVAGGVDNTAGGQSSFAAGTHAKALHTGAFVWADSTGADFASTANNQFNIRATGGVRLSDNTPNLSFGSQTRQMLNLWGTLYGIGVQADTLYSRCDATSANGGFIWYKGGVHDDGYAQPGAGGTELMHLVQGALYVNGALVPLSDRNAKENFAPVQPREVLERVVALPLSSWNYKADTATRHLGPMAQDFYAAFNVGPDDKHIATVDADGVALAAIQGLNQKLEAGSQKSEDRIQKLETENAELKQRLEKLEQLMNQNNRGAQ